VSAAPARALPRWADLVVLPLLNLGLALLASALVVLIAGASPLAALSALTRGAFGDADSIGYTLYYATDMIFAGLAVAVAFHAGLFNIGVEGQAYVAGLGAAIVCLHAARLPSLLVLPLAVAASALFGAAWAAIPGWLQAWRGSHVVITTIMFNFIAYSLMVYLLVNVLIAPGQMSPETRVFAANATMPPLAGRENPLNLALPLALLCLAMVWVLLWHTPFGYALRVAGAAPRAALYAGINPRRIVLAAMLLSGALAGGIAVNEVMGAQHKLTIGFTSGYGFTGIAVALMGRNHPAGILPAAILFGALYQGGAEMSFDLPSISNDLVVAIQGLVILTTGAMPFLLRPALARIVGR
jgi:simple sugar transport system permease protein